MELYEEQILSRFEQNEKVQELEVRIRTLQARIRELEARPKVGTPSNADRARRRDAVGNFESLYKAALARNVILSKQLKELGA